MDMGQIGIIFTDTNVLAGKYHCQRSEVEHLLHTFICDSESHGIDWNLVDVGNGFDYIFSQDISWQAYCRALNDYCAGMGWQTDYRTPLMIVGGDDVIPIPILEFPPSEGNAPVPLQVDMLYGYPCDFQILDEIAELPDHNLPLCSAMLRKAIFNVARLPLEIGLIKTSLQQDLGGYFSRSVESGGCIQVNYVLPTSAYNWYMSVRSITEGIPLLPLGSDTRCWLSDIYISPNLNMGDSSAMQHFTDDIGKADMLLFNTHGCDDPEQSGFYGQGPLPERGDEQISYVEKPLAFDVQLLPYCKAKVFATLACWGARFDKDKSNQPYQRKQSMLLSAIYGGALLYMGSCEVSWGRGGIKDPGNAMRLTGYSETLMKKYINLLMNGVPAGVALLEAKWSYCEECFSEDSPISALYTIFEFNQFGNPALKVVAPSYNRQSNIQKKFNSIPQRCKSYKLQSQKFTSLYSTGIGELDRLYQDVRQTLDSSLMQLSNNLCQMLQRDYCYSSANLFLTDIICIEENDGAMDYLFQYSYESFHDNEHVIFVRIDSHRQLKDVMHTI